MTNDLKSQIDKGKMPRHIAIIMDGNGRWAKEQNKSRLYGHRYGVKTVRRIVEASREIELEYLTLYTFSTENWKRPKQEVSGLMNLLVQTIRKELNELHKNNISIRVIGELEKVPPETLNEVLKAVEKTKDNDGLKLIMALSYGSRWDIVEASKRIISDACQGKLQAADFNEKLFKSYLSTADFPDPELLIRTSGEYRISNFLLWELAYSELYFTPKKWPEFTKEDFFEAIIDFQKRERRFGRVSEQIKR
ncbi:MAG TPA: isoprenyl transferase [Bacteroidia bacterium]|nr:isoprenyl transferase [Sphingobacteriales bacterium]HPD65771.1 isoprenyl transferase [Bacteroidia bacterium]HRS59512.1 isoprenyl transferase [Bacteroidia bacterium]HRU67596.1 isoprenyl transferase [Bacteroidia bacterium]